MISKRVFQNPLLNTIVSQIKRQLTRVVFFEVFIGIEHIEISKTRRQKTSRPLRGQYSRTSGKLETWQTWRYEPEIVSA